jgi:hypothetical protein
MTIERERASFVDKLIEYESFLYSTILHPVEIRSAFKIQPGSGRPSPWRADWWIRAKRSTAAVPLSTATRAPIEKARECSRLPISNVELACKIKAASQEIRKISPFNFEGRDCRLRGATEPEADAMSHHGIIMTGAPTLTRS